MVTSSCGALRADWTLGAAARYEHFADFGATLNGKLSGRVPLSGRIALRGSLGTGFRAPTPGQQNAFNVSARYVPALDDLVNDGTISSTSAVARLRGGRPLLPERSVNISVGAVAGGGPFTLTVDYFRIDLADRLTLSRSFELDATGSRGPARRGHHQRRRPRELPVLHQRPGDPDPGARTSSRPGRRPRSAARPPSASCSTTPTPPPPTSIPPC